MTQENPALTFEQRPAETDEEAGRRLFENVYAQVYGGLPRPHIPMSLNHPASLHRAGSVSSTIARELKAIREREGDGAALAHASGMVIAACMFVAFDLNQPETAKTTVSYWAKRLNQISDLADEADIRESAETPLKQ